jgi:hypothetical protein
MNLGKVISLAIAEEKDGHVGLYTVHDNDPPTYTKIGHFIPETQKFLLSEDIRGSAHKQEERGKTPSRPVMICDFTDLIDERKAPVERPGEDRDGLRNEAGEPVFDLNKTETPPKKEDEDNGDGDNKLENDDGGSKQDNGGDGEPKPEGEQGDGAPKTEPETETKE